jgi:hypothetical protein
MHERKYVSIHLLILVGLSILTIILFFRFSTEDSYITYRYAQNLIDGKGFTYNQGDEFLGTTAPFYGLILAFFGFLGFNIPSIGGILSASSLGLAVILIYLLTLKKGYPLVGLLCGLFIFLNPWFLQTFGSETYFELLMIIGAFYFYDQDKYLPTAVFCSLAFLVRPDGIIPAIIIFLDYIIKNKKFPAREVILFATFSVPVLLFYYFIFNTFLPNTLEAKQAQYASGLWYRFVPGALKYAGLILKDNGFLYFLIPLMIIGVISILFSLRIWFLIALWAFLHTVGYTLLKVTFYHWYLIPLLFLLMLLSAFSVRFIISAPGLFKESKVKKWNLKIFNQEIKISLNKFKDIGTPLKWTYRILSFAIIASLVIALIGGIRAYYNTHKALPSPKLQLYTQAGKWIASNTPSDATISALEVGYIGYHAQRRVVDLVGLVTPEVSKHIRNRDFKWAFIKYRPDYFIHTTEFNGWLETVIDQQWFHESYKKIMEMNQSGYTCDLQIFKKILDPDFKKTSTLVMDSSQDESDFSPGEIVKGMEIGQTFYCNNDNLARIKVMLATYNRENHQDVIFHLKKSPDSEEDIYTEKFNASEVIDNAYRSFDFPPIPDSKGKTFYFSLESPQSNNRDAITVWAVSENKYNMGQIYINRKKIDGDLRFITYFYED